MTVFARWDPQENGDLLLILYFVDDGTRPNLRFINAHPIKVTKIQNSTQLIPITRPDGINPRAYSWAIRHTEDGIIGELLSFANRINGNDKRNNRQSLIKWIKTRPIVHEEICELLDRIRERWHEDGGLTDMLWIWDDQLLGCDNHGFFFCDALTERYVETLRTYE